MTFCTAARAKVTMEEDCLRAELEMFYDVPAAKVERLMEKIRDEALKPRGFSMDSVWGSVFPDEMDAPNGVPEPEMRSVIWAWRELVRVEEEALKSWKSICFT